MQLYPWLAYSEYTSGGFCTPCVLFATLKQRGAEPGMLVQRPLVSFSKALEVLSKHANRDFYKAAVVRAHAFMQVMSNNMPDIRCRMNQALMNRIATNRRKLASIIDTIVFCGRQNVALCGHHDSATDLERDTSENHGNFWALLKFRVDAGDTILKEHLETAAKNALYTSPIIQNQIICNHIQQKILEKVKNAK